MRRNVPLRSGTPVVSQGKTWVIAAAALAVAALARPSFGAGPEDCAAAIDRAGLRFESRIHKALAACETREASGRECDAESRDRALDRADSALDSRLASACSESDLVALEFPGSCEDADGAPFDASDLADCIRETHRAAIDAAIDVEFPGATEDLSGPEAACQKSIGRAALTFVRDDLAARQRCLREDAEADCNDEGASTGSTDIGASLGDAQTELASTIEEDCAGAALGKLGFPGNRDGGTAGFETDDLSGCLITTHDADARAMLAAEHPGVPAPTTTTSTSTSTTTDTVTTTTLPSLDDLTSIVGPYGDADADGFTNNVELAACSNPADAGSTPLNDSSLCANQTIFSDTLGPSWGNSDRMADPTYFAAVNALAAQNALDCSAYCATTTNIGSPHACEGVWPWTGAPEYGHYTHGHSVEVTFPDESGNRLHGTIFLPPEVTCSAAVSPICDGVTDAITCTGPSGNTYPAVALCDGFLGSQRMYYWAGQRLAEQGYVAMAFDVSGQGLSQGAFPNSDVGIAGDIPGGGEGFARDIGTAMNFLASADNPVRNLIRVDPLVIVNQATGAADHLEPYVLGVAGHSLGATASIAYQQSTEAAYPVRARAVVAWSHFDADNTIGNVPIQLHSGDNDNGFIQPPSSDNLGPEMQLRYGRLGGDRDLDGTADFSPHDRQIIFTEAGTHLDYSSVPWAYTPVWSEELQYHYTLAWFDKYLSGDVRRRMGDVTGGVIHSIDRYSDYAACETGPDCYSATERLEMSHTHLSGIWCSRYDVGGVSTEDMKGGGCRTE